MWRPRIDPSRYERRHWSEPVLVQEHGLEHAAVCVLEVLDRPALGHIWHRSIISGAVAISHESDGSLS